MKRFTIDEFRERYATNDACLDKIFQLRYAGLVCPKCENDKPFQRVKNRRAYQCPCCSYQLYPTEGTIFEKTTTPLTYWFYAIYLQTTTRNGVAAKELERQLNICYKTALRMAHQIKILMSDQSKVTISGIVQCDETFVGGLNKNRHADKKVEQSQGRSFKDKTPVFGMVTKGGKEIIAKVIDDTSSNSILPIIKESVDKENSIIVTDEWLAYNTLKDEYKHVILNHGEKEYARGAFDTNTIEGVWSQLKRTIKGTHIKVSRKHLQKYVDEVVFRYKKRGEQDTMFESILSRVVSPPSSKPC